MTCEIKKLTGIAAILAALAATPAMAQEMGADWDTDGDTMLSAEEFAEGFRERAIFSGWDQNKDNLLSEDEFSGGVYSTYDRDANDGLDETEYGLVDEGAPGYWNREVTAEGYQAWDIDGDGVILSNEFADGFGEVGLLGEWDVDRDGSLNEEEFTNGVFERYDEDGTGIIEEPELTDIGDDMGDEGFWDV